MKREKGLTIIQIMAVLLIAGLVGHFVVKYVIEQRCANGQSSALCEGSKSR